MDYTPEYLERALKRMMQEPANDQHALMWRLFFLLRPKNCRDITSATQKLADLLGLIERNPDYATALRTHLFSLINQKQISELLMSADILPTHSFAGEFSRRLQFKLLPPLPLTHSLRDWLDNTLREDDSVWIGGIDPSLWQRLFITLKTDVPAADFDQLNINFREAINGLSHRIAAAGLEQELLAREPELSQHASPFLAQHEEIATRILGNTDQLPDIAQAQVLIEQCQEVLNRIARNVAHQGTSIELTHLRVRLEQQLARLDLLLRILSTDGLAQLDLIISLFVTISDSTRERYSIRRLLRDTTQQLAYQITQHAGHTGEHYVAEDRSALFSMFYSASGAGIIIAVMALLKIFIAKSHFLPLQEAALVSLNYAFGFVLVYMLGLTIATKQPAMTASWMAQTLTQLRTEASQFKALQTFIQQVFKSQLMAILGNLIFAFLTAFAIMAVADHFWHWKPIGTDKAQILLNEVSLLAPMNWFYAAVAAVGLFLSGVVSGYYDNKSIHEKIPQRLALLTWPTHIIGAHLWRWITRYVEHNLGALAGNFFFGLYLGLVAAFGSLSGLPLDIRHIAFGAANLAYALFTLGWQAGWVNITLGSLGVLAIGFINLTVSFSLAFYLALRASKMSRQDARRWLIQVVSDLLTAPWRFIAKLFRS
ncbi:site-specific recombinase [Sulfuriferula nivalis]|uniref:Recombinase n=1 Tax=Sulfuriferula nivalis TaxID=2675298 RepID=A0A809RII9_9PROT|nr:site-specific recombinase [Sulfuriferula nivalis]BBP01729.1 recombinase [Sulfuriferula nivalis]